MYGTRIALTFTALALSGALGAGYAYQDARVQDARLETQTLAVKAAQDLTALQATADEKIAKVETALAQALQPTNLATYRPSKAWPEWNQAIAAGIAYWNGRDGHTPRVAIVRSATNMCDVPAAGCAQGWSDQTCRVYIDKTYKGDRWALQAIATHEVGHCVGKKHDPNDFVMQP